MTQMTIGDKILQWKALQDRQEALDLKVKAILHKIQQECLHPEEFLVEGQAAGSAPFRVCRQCGYSEKGWEVGYSKLAPNSYEVSGLSYKGAFAFVKGPMVRQAMGGGDE
jgi:hypothetical protein